MPEAKDNWVAGRAMEKRRSRRADDLRIERGVDGRRIQRENSVFSGGFFKGAKISNLRRAVGR